MVITTTVVGLARLAPSWERAAQASTAPMAIQAPEAMAASSKGRREGRLLQGEDQAADRGRIVVGGDPRARRARRPALGGTPRCVLLPGLGIAGRAIGRSVGPSRGSG